MKTIRVELTFSSGKFIAWDKVKEIIWTEDKKAMVLVIDNPDYANNNVSILVDKLDFYEVFDNNEH